jgi:hypothetical protein
MPGVRAEIEAINVHVQDPNYRRKLRLAIPSLEQIDATLCRA